MTEDERRSCLPSCCMESYPALSWHLDSTSQFIRVHERESVDKWRWADLKLEVYRNELREIDRKLDATARSYVEMYEGTPLVSCIRPSTAQ